MCSPVTKINFQTPLTLAAAAKDPQKAYDHLSEILQKIHPEHPIRSKIESLKNKVALLVDFSESLSKTSKKIERISEHTSLTSPKKQHIWNFQKEIANERGGKLRIYECNIEPMKSYPITVDGNPIIWLGDDMTLPLCEKYFKIINENLFPAIELPPKTAITRLPCNDVVEMYHKNVAQTKVRDAYLNSERLKWSEGSIRKFDCQFVKSRFDSEYDNSQRHLASLLADISSGCINISQLSEKIAKNFGSLVRNLQEQLSHDPIQLKSSLGLDTKEQKTNLHILSKNLGYKIGYNHKTELLEITLPDKDALKANWRHCRKKFPELPKFRLKGSEGVADHLSFVMAYLQYDALLSTDEEFVHDHLLHILPAIALFFSRNSESPLKEQIDHHIVGKNKVKEKIAECLVHLLWAKQTGSFDDRKELPILEYILGAFVDSASATYNYVGRLCENLVDIEIIPDIILRSSNWRNVIEAKHGKINVEKITELWKKVMNAKIGTLPHKE